MKQTMTDTEYVRTVTKLSDRDHERLVRYYSGLRPRERIAVHGLHTTISRTRSGQKDPSHGVAYYHATFLLAVRAYKTAQNPQLSKRMTKKKAIQIDGLQAVHAKAREGRKASVAQTLVERNYDLIKMLREETPRPMGWRSIAGRLSAKGQRISHTAAKSIWEKLAEEGGP